MVVPRRNIHRHSTDFCKTQYSTIIKTRLLRRSFGDGIHSKVTSLSPSALIPRIHKWQPRCRPLFNECTLCTVPAGKQLRSNTWVSCSAVQLVPSTYSSLKATCISPAINLHHGTHHAYRIPDRYSGAIRSSLSAVLSCQVQMYSCQSWGKL